MVRRKRLTPEARRCARIKDDGERCKAAAVKRSEYCYFHAPETRELLLKSARKGSIMAQKPKDTGCRLPEARSHSDLAANISQIQEWVLSGKIDSKTANILLTAEAIRRQSLDRMLEIALLAESGPVYVRDPEATEIEEKPDPNREVIVRELKQ